MIARIRSLSLLALLCASVPWLALAPAAAAHEGVEVGEFILTIGWRNEPALVGQPNGVQVFVANHDDESPVNTGVALDVVVSTAGQSTEAVSLTPQFVVGEFGTPGEYGTDLIPTAPGDYTFRFTGSVGDTDVDVEMTSGEDTFSPIEGSSDLEFPVKLPSTGEIVTRLERIDGRIAALASAGSGDEITRALDTATAAVDAAQRAVEAANVALLVGAGLGAAGIVLGLIGIALARAGRRGSSAA